MDPVDNMLKILEDNFDANKPTKEIFSLELNNRNMGKKMLNTLSYYGSGILYVYIFCIMSINVCIYYCYTSIFSIVS